MRSLKILVVFVAIVFFGIENIYGQNASDNSLGNEKKVTTNELPAKVKDALKNYSGYKISKDATLRKSNNNNIYTFKIEKGIWVNYLMINEKGKVLGIKSEEGNKVQN